MTRVNDGEEIARLLFYPQMINDGVLTPSAFPMDELLAIKGKNGASVDRSELLSDRDKFLNQKALEIANPVGGRAPFGFCLGNVGKIRKIKEEKEAAQALDIWPDEITGNDPPKPWDAAHALLRKFDDEYTRANLRGIRDHLSCIFSRYVVEF